MRLRATGVHALAGAYRTCMPIQIPRKGRSPDARYSLSGAAKPRDSSPYASISNQVFEAVFVPYKFLISWRQ